MACPTKCTGRCTMMCCQCDPPSSRQIPFGRMLSGIAAHVPENVATHVAAHVAAHVTGHVAGHVAVHVAAHVVESGDRHDTIPSKQIFPIWQ